MLPADPGAQAGGCRRACMQVARLLLHGSLPAPVGDQQQTVCFPVKQSHFRFACSRLACSRLACLLRLRAESGEPQTANTTDPRCWQHKIEVGVRYLRLRWMIGSRGGEGRSVELGLSSSGEPCGAACARRCGDGQSRVGWCGIVCPTRPEMSSSGQRLFVIAWFAKSSCPEPGPESERMSALPSQSAITTRCSPMEQRDGINFESAGAGSFRVDTCAECRPSKAGVVTVVDVGW